MQHFFSFIFSHQEQKKFSLILQVFLMHLITLIGRRCGGKTYTITTGSTLDNHLHKELVNLWWKNCKKDFVRRDQPIFFHFGKFSYTDLEFLPYYLIQRALICNTTKTRSAPKILRSIGSVYLIFSLVSDFFYLIFLQQLGWQLFLDLGGATVSNRANRIKNKMELTEFVLYTTHQIFNIRIVVSVGEFMMLSWFL